MGVCRCRSITNGRESGRLYHYGWLGTLTQNSNAGRIEQIKAEALRRGRPEIIEHVSAIMQLYGLPRPSDPKV